MDCEVPNVCLVNGKIDKTALAPPAVPKAQPNAPKMALKKRRLGQKPAAKAAEEAAADEKVSDAEEKEEDAENDPGSTLDLPGPVVSPDTSMKLICVGAHKQDHFAIQLITKGNDKAQLCLFQGEEDKEARFEKLKAVIQPAVDKLSKGVMNVKSIPKDILIDMRKLCQQERETWRSFDK